MVETKSPYQAYRLALRTHEPNSIRAMRTSGSARAAEIGKTPSCADIRRLKPTSAVESRAI